jgi:Ca-activated chloride channel family protein
MAAALLGITAAVPARAQFRSGVEMVPLTVTVTDPAGRFVPNLTAGDFTILEDGKAQQLSTFATVEAPVDLTMLIDTSSSMHQDLRLAQEAASGLTRSLRSGDHAGVMGVATSVSKKQEVTADLSRVEEAIRSLQASGATAIYEAIYVALREFQVARRAATNVRRQAIVLLSDGLDTASHIPFEHVLDSVRRGDVTIFVIQLERNGKLPMDVDDSRYAFEARFAMRALARDSGGRFFTAQAATELPAIYNAIARELGNQYVLGYVPARQGGDGAFRRIAVHVRHPQGTHARTRAGYYAHLPRSTLVGPRSR